MAQVLDRERAGEEQGVKLAVIDTDIHPALNPFLPAMVKHLPQRWMEYLGHIGVRYTMPGGDRPRHREFAHRWDTAPPDGSDPGSNEEFARHQLLDRFDMSAGILNNIGGFMGSGQRSMPMQMAESVTTALNRYLIDEWLARDPRWYGSMNTSYEFPEIAVKQIAELKDDPTYGPKWAQAMFTPDNERPFGNRRYWPIFEVCEHYGLPIAFHVLSARQITGTGNPSYYFEEHCDFAQLNFALVSSLIFEGVFDRFPNLKVGMIELGWTWAVPYGWRMDRAYGKMRNESKLERRPSEYLRDHFWFSTQPMEEPSTPSHFQSLVEALEFTGMGDKLMYSSDYPHWDFDEPFALPTSVKGDQLKRILADNASKLYGIETIPGTGVVMDR
jgi:predicted TIM-barrel fold metal-dependent hydrolase